MDKLKPHILPIIIGLFSLLSLLDNLDLSNIPKFIISIIGMIGVLLYYLNHEKASLLVKIWIFAQFPILFIESTEILDNGMEYIKYFNIWNTAQVMEVKLGLTLNDINIYLNPVPFLFLGFYRLLKYSNYIGKEVEITNGLNRKNKYGEVFPLYGEVKSAVKFDEKLEWLLVDLIDPLIFNSIEFKQILILPKDDDYFIINKAQLSYLRLINPEFDIESLKIKKKNDYPFIDFVNVMITAKKANATNILDI